MWGWHGSRETSNWFGAVTIQTTKHGPTSEREGRRKWLLDAEWDLRRIVNGRLSQNISFFSASEKLSFQKLHSSTYIEGMEFDSFENIKFEKHKKLSEQNSDSELSKWKSWKFQSTRIDFKENLRWNFSELIKDYAFSNIFHFWVSLECLGQLCVPSCLYILLVPTLAKSRLL